jgi:hypothetical protein
MQCARPNPSLQPMPGMTKKEAKKEMARFAIKQLGLLY